MINIRNQYLQHYFEQTGDYRRAYEYLRRDQELNWFYPERADTYSCCGVRHAI